MTIPILTLPLSLLCVLLTAAGRGDECCTPAAKLCCSTPAADCCAVTGDDSSAVTLPIAAEGQKGQQAFIDAFEEMGRTVYECAGHPQAASDEPGTCQDCGGMALRPRKVPTFASLSISVQDGVGYVSGRMAPGETLRLSAVEDAARDAPVSLDLERLELAGSIELHVAGMSCEACSSKLSAALAAVAAIQRTACELGSRQESIVELTTETVAYSVLRKTVELAGFQLTGVTWTGAVRSPSEPTARYGVGIGFQKIVGAESELRVGLLLPDSAGEKAGLRVGDRILTIAGNLAFEYTRDELEDLFGSPKPVRFEIERDGKTLAVDVVPQVLEDDAPEDQPRARRVGLNVGDTAPEIEGEDLDGVSFKLSDYRGKVTAITFWAFW